MRIFSLLSIGLLGLSSAAERPDNVILIFTDDQGYNDLGCFGSKTIKTPHLDKMAEEGRKFTSFMVPSPVCSPSRAGLLTGSYPKRVEMHKGVLFPSSTVGLNPEEHTIADHLKQQGYATACIGKWHLGHHPEVLPTAQGFDYYYGIPYSNDMNHPANKNKPRDSSDALWLDQESSITKWKTPLMENEKIIELPVDQRTITRRYTNKAIDFIKENKQKPFFIYLPHSMPHIPLYVPDEFFDPDPKKAYIKVIEHIDAEVGRILQTLKQEGLDKNTLVIFTTDNGPWLPFKHHGGSALPLREGKGTTFEGGQRVPCLMWHPAKIPAGSETSKLMSSIDLLPSLSGFLRLPQPKVNKIDGLDLHQLMLGKQSEGRNEFLYYSSNGKLDGIRMGKWKYLKPSKWGRNLKDVKPGTEFLFDLENDVAEKVNLFSQQKEVVSRLKARMQELDSEIESQRRKRWKKQ